MTSPSTLSTTTARGRIGHCFSVEETLLECLGRHFGLPSDESERLISFGAVYLDRQRVSGNRPLLAGQYVRVHLQPKRFPVDGIDWRATLVHDNESFVVVNKPARIPVHATVDNLTENLLHQLSAALGAPLHITQRLDQEVGGLIVIARTPEFQRSFNRLLLERKVKKRYRALVRPAPAIGRYVHYMQPGDRGPKTVSPKARPDWQECALRVLNVEAVGDVFEVEIDLETGRTHQIRAQLSALGCPIAGDTLYGSATPYALSGIALFSASTSWENWAFALAPPWNVAEKTN